MSNKTGHHAAPHLVQSWWQLRVDQLEEEAPEGLDLAPAGHVHTAGAKRGGQAQVGADQGEQGEHKLLLRPERMGGEGGEGRGGEGRGGEGRGGDYQALMPYTVEPLYCGHLSSLGSLLGLIVYQTSTEIYLHTQINPGVLTLWTQTEEVGPP